MREALWTSPDGKIVKEIATFGAFGAKPTENSECKIHITNTSNLDVKKYNESPFIIGDVHSSFDKLLDICLQNMCPGEIANVTLNTNTNPTQTFTVKLETFESKGLIWEWKAPRKFELALDHKKKGVELFKTDFKAASWRFGKALKLLCSIPVDVERPPQEVDGVLVKDIENLKVLLYNNLAYCFLNNKDYAVVIRLCNKALGIDKDNVKALYRCGLAHYEERNYEEAVDVFKSVLHLEPHNKAAVGMLKNADNKLAEATVKVNDMFKRMFPS